MERHALLRNPLTYLLTYLLTYVVASSGERLRGEGRYGVFAV